MGVDMQSLILQALDEIQMPDAEMGQRLVSLISYLDNLKPPSETEIITPTCASVLLSRDRKELFDELILKSQRQWDIVEALLLIRPTEIIPFFEQVQTVAISATRLGYVNRERDWQRAYSALTQYAPHLSSITRVVFQRVDWTLPTLKNDLVSNLGFSQQITKLELMYCKFENPSQLYELISRFPALVDLTLSKNSFKYSSSCPSSAMSLSTGMVRNLSRLEWHPSRTTKETNEAFSHILSVVDSQSLKHVAADVWGQVEIEGSIPFTADLSRFTNLKSLKIETMDIPADFIPSRFKHTVSQLSNPHFDDLYLKFTSFRPPSKPFDLTAFKECDEVLSRPHFQALKRISIVIELAVAEKDLPTPIDQFPSNAATAAVAMLVPCSSPSEDSVTGPNDQASSEGESLGERAYLLFRELVANGVRRQIERQFERLESHGILQLEVKIGTDTTGKPFSTHFV